jgi:predicted GNAT family acetyltransferase
MSAESVGSAAAEIVDDKEQSRYEAHLGGETVAIADYVKQPGIVSFTHTETFDGHKGQGIAGRLIDRALRDARAEALEVVPFCWFVAKYIGGHREYLDLVPADRRPEFGLPTE